MNYHSDTQKNILVVDDTKANLRLLTEILSREGYAVRPVSTSARAIAAAQSKRPDLILLDIIMPDMDGFSICSELKRDSRTQNVPVIFISALTETVDKVKAFSLGGVDFITKPFQTEEVLARVKIHLELEDIRQRLRVRNQELAMLNKLTRQLEDCEKELETYPLIAEAVQELFPDGSGLLARFHEDQQPPEIIIEWGEPLSELDLSFMDQSPTLLSAEEPHHLSGNYELPMDRLGRVVLPVRWKSTLAAAIVFTLGPAVPKDSGVRMLIPNCRRILLKQLVGLYALTLSGLRLRQTLRLESIHDYLTGLYTRRHMESVLHLEWHRAKRKKQSLGIIVFHVDQFKILKDRYGQRAGDLVLTEMGKLVVKYIRKGDIACRTENDEFFIILPETNLECTHQRGVELVEQVRDLRIQFDEHLITWSISAGIAAYTDFDQPVMETAQLAERALLRAIRQGRNQAVIWQPK